jgi:hypothetical protein
MPEGQLLADRLEDSEAWQVHSLSLITPGSSMNAAFGNVSAGGLGTPELDVTHIGGGPWTFVTTQPGRNIGGITLSKLSPNSTGVQHGGHCGGLEATTEAEISNVPGHHSHPRS